jgi:ELWxxDGT repeat protein
MVESFWTPLVGWHGQVLLQGTDETSGTELWATDGTPAGTRLVADLCPGDCSSSPVVLGKVQGALLRQAHDGMDARGRPQLLPIELAQRLPAELDRCEVLLHRIALRTARLAK